MENVNNYGRFTEEMWFSGEDKPFDINLAIMTLGLAGEAGEVVEHVKKYLRGDGAMDSDKLLLELGDVAFYWARIATFLGFNPSEVLAANVDKLTSRRQRGVMRGNGDAR